MLFWKSGKKIICKIVWIFFSFFHLFHIFLMIFSSWVTINKHRASCCYDHVWIIQNLSLRFCSCSVFYGLWEIGNRSTFFYSISLFFFSLLYNFSWSAHLRNLFRIYPWGFIIVQFYAFWEIRKKTTSFYKTNFVRV